MKKLELIKLIASTNETSQLEAEKKIDCINEIIELAVKNLEVGDKVKIGDFLVLEKKVQAARTARNPKNPEETISVPEKTVVKIKSSATFKKL